MNPSPFGKGSPQIRSLASNCYSPNSTTAAKPGTHSPRKDSHGQDGSNTMPSTRVMIVDDSPLMRNFLAECVGHTPDLEVVATAHDAVDALEKLQSEEPDVITLDIEMPGMDGLAFLEMLMSTRPTAVVMVSALTQTGATATLRALQLGAVDVVGKPATGTQGISAIWLDELLTKLRRAARIRPQSTGQRFHRPSVDTAQELEQAATCTRHCRERLILIGAGTGATTSLLHLLREFPRDCPPVLAALQLSPMALDVVVARASRDCGAQLKFAASGKPLLRGHIHICPGGADTVVERFGGQCIARVGAASTHQTGSPSINRLFGSAAKQFGADAVGILLDAAGTDGIAGVGAFTECGARVIREVSEWRPSGNFELSTSSSWRTSPESRLLYVPITKISEVLFGSST